MADNTNFTVGGRTYVARDLFTYEVDFDVADLTAGATVNGSIAIQADSDFVWQKGVYMADLGGAAETDSGRIIPLVTVLLTDTGSGRNLMSSNVPVPSLFGDGRLPFVLPIPRLFFARSTLTVQVTNYSTGTAYGLRLSFIGYKAYPRES